MEKNLKVLSIASKDTYKWLLEKHYAKRIPNITNSFGLFNNNILIGVVTYGIPASPSLCKGICGENYAKYVIELNRLCLQNNNKNESSILVGRSLKLLPKPKIVVSYADTSQGHIGYVYQATNFIYTGLSDKRTEWRIKNSNKHSKTISEQYSLEERKNNPDKFEVVDRPRKHRYIFFVANKKDKKIFMNNLKYKISQYPKGTSKRYDSGNNVTTQILLI